MSDFTNDWNSLAPLDHDKFRNQPSNVRTVKVDLADRFSAMFGGFVSGETSMGAKILRFLAQTTPTFLAGIILLYGKTVGSYTELHCMTGSGLERQLTGSGGFLNAIMLRDLSSLPASAGVMPAANLPVAAAPIPPLVSLGSISGAQSLAVDTAYTAALTGDVTLTLPTPSSGFMHTIAFEFTMASAQTVTVSGVTWNFGATPVLATGSVKNRMVFDTIDGGSTWKGYYSQF